MNDAIEEVFLVFCVVTWESPHFKGFFFIINGFAFFSREFFENIIFFKGVFEQISFFSNDFLRKEKFFGHFDIAECIIDLSDADNRFEETSA